MGTVGAAFGTFWIVLIIIAAILAFFTPFFILRIQSEIIKTNKNLKKIINLLENQHISHLSLSDHQNSKVCIRCGTKNEEAVTKCQQCGARF
ncbi:MAG: hypothetical protein KJ915_13755 [Candidatus Omnitrophica bacterium]|nr:hypothetical protein [Candidatus Omnitrophota bacterium]